MKLSKLIIPEVLMGRRGSKNAIEMMKAITDGVSLGTSEGLPCIQLSNKAANHFLKDVAAAGYFFLAKLFKQKSGKVYYIPAAFAQALSKIDRALPVAYLPDQFLGYLQFGDGALFDDDGEVEGAFVYIGTAAGIGLKDGDSFDPSRKVMTINYSNYASETPGIPGIIYRFSQYVEPKTVSEFIDEYDVDYTLEGEKNTATETNASNG